LSVAHSLASAGQTRGAHPEALPAAVEVGAGGVDAGEEVGERVVGGDFR